MRKTRKIRAALVTKFYVKNAWQKFQIDKIDSLDER